MDHPNPPSKAGGAKKRRPRHRGPPKAKGDRSGVAVDEEPVKSGPNAQPASTAQPKRVAKKPAAKAAPKSALEERSFAEQKRTREAARKARKQGAPVRAYVGNLPYDVTRAQLEAWITDHHVAEVRNVALKKGQAFVALGSQASLDRLVALSGQKLRDRALRIEVAHSNKAEEKESKSTSAASSKRKGGGGGGRGGRERSKFKEYMAVEEATAAIEAGLLCRGVLRVNPHNRREAYATVPGFVYDVKMRSLTAQNRALDGDVVAIRINARSDWIDMEGPPENDANEEDEVSSVDENDDDDDDDDVDVDEAAPVTDAEEQEVIRQLSAMELEQKEASDTNKRPTGCVVCILEKKSSSKYVGWLRAANASGKDDEFNDNDEYAFLIPFARKMHRILVPLGRLPHSWRSAAKYRDHLYMCEVSNWKITSSSPFGQLVKDYGKGGDLEVEKTILLEANNIDFDDGFSRAVNACLPPQDYRVPDEELARRRDFRKTLIMSIDPATAKDLDDALSIEKLDNGNWQVGVHIADVSYFVQPGTALDDEARERATSIYLVNECIPMLPRILSERLCSLNTGQDSLSFSAIFELNARGDVVKEWFGRGIIRNACQMSYEVAQSIIDDTADMEAIAKRIDPSTTHTAAQVVEAVQSLNTLAHVMRAKRFEGGSVQLKSIKLAFSLDPDTGKPVSVRQYVQKPANELVEEFMLLANKRVAMFSLKHFPNGALLRRHERPGLKMKDFVALCAKFGFKVDATTSRSFNETMAAIRDPERPHVSDIIYYLALRAMQLARYTETCEKNDAETYYHHYALGFQHYTHFTSPIRRYADLMVHRILQACLDGRTQAPEAPETVKEICENCNERKVRADRASERSDIVFLCHLFKDQPVRELEGYVYKVSSKSFDIMVPEFGIEDGIQLDRLGVVATSNFDEDRMTLTATFDSYKPDLFAGQDDVDDDNEQRSKSISVTMFQRVVVVGRIKTEKRELDMGLGLVIDANGIKSKPSPQRSLHVDETCDAINGRDD